MTRLLTTPEAEASLKLRGFFVCSPAIVNGGLEYHCEDWTGARRHLVIWSCGVAHAETPYENTDLHTSLGAHPLASDQELLAFLDELGWVEQGFKI